MILNPNICLGLLFILTVLLPNRMSRMTKQYLFHLFYTRGEEYAYVVLHGGVEIEINE